MANPADLLSASGFTRRTGAYWWGTSIPYQNHRGEAAVRRIGSGRLWFGVSLHHEGEQWFLHAYDLDKRAYRDFALKGFLPPACTVEAGNDPRNTAGCL